MVNRERIPVIDVSPLRAQGDDRSETAEAIRRACRDCGFFYVMGHGMDESLCRRLAALSREFFSQPQAEKMKISMERGGRAWRGYFPVGGELTSGLPDQKEGLYFGAELDNDHPQVRLNTPLFGRNLFPEIAGFRQAVLDYIDAMTGLGHLLMEGLAMSLGLMPSYFFDRYTRDPLILFRIFHYPPLADPSVPQEQPLWSVGEHTDYGLLTILLQDETGGLQVKSKTQWIDAPPLANSFVCNIGDMLDRMTSGLYRSTPHRVRNTAAQGRLSFPFFFDPNFEAKVNRIEPNLPVEDDEKERWDQSSVHQFEGTYGDYILNKVRKVFPQLGQGAQDDDSN